MYRLPPHNNHIYCLYFLTSATFHCLFLLITAMGFIFFTSSDKSHFPLSLPPHNSNELHCIHHVGPTSHMSYSLPSFNTPSKGHILSTTHVPAICSTVLLPDSLPLPHNTSLVSLSSPSHTYTSQGSNNYFD